MSYDGDTNAARRILPTTQNVSTNHSKSHPFPIDDSDQIHHLVKEATNALKMLQSIDIDAVSRNSNLHDGIKIASGAISQFLQKLVTPPTPEGLAKMTLPLFGALANPSFLAILFKYREIFHGLASQALLHDTTPSAVVSWVDVILANLGDVIAVVATEFHAESLPQPMPHVLNVQRAEDGLWAASQLPGTWEAIPSVLSSDHASPAAKRLVLRLIFAAFFLSQESCKLDLRSHSRQHLGSLAKNLRIYSQNLLYGDSQAQNAAIDNSLQARITYSMLLSLASKSCSDATHQGALSALQAYTYGSFLTLIRIVMHPEGDIEAHEIIRPLEILDPAQVILVRWIVSWSWMTWSDRRALGYDCLISLTATWLGNLETIPYGASSEDLAKVLTPEILDCLLQDPTPGLNMMLHVLHLGVSTYSSTVQTSGCRSHLLPILDNSCQVILSLDQLGVDWKHSGLCLKLCQYLFAFFVLIDSADSGVEVQEKIIGVLLLNDNNTLQLALHNICDDNRVSFTTNLDNSLSQCTLLLCASAECWTPKQNLLMHIKVMLEFLTVIWHSGFQGFLPTKITSNFLNILTSQQFLSSPSGIVLYDGLLTALTSIQKLYSVASLPNVTKTWKDSIIWKVAQQFHCSDLFSAAAFANYIISTSHVYDALLCTQAWSYLQDVLLHIITHQFEDDHEALALLISPVICQALVALSIHAEQAVVCYITTSPWTRNLCKNLHAVLNDERLTKYLSVLKDKISLVGDLLHDQIFHMLTYGSAASNVVPLQQKLYLHFCHSHHSTKILLAP